VTVSSLKRLARNWTGAFLVPRPIVGVFFLPRYIRDWFAYSRVNRGKKIKLADSYPCLSDWVTKTPFDPHYYYQGAWLSRLLIKAKPERHVDVGSSVTMVSVLSASIPMIFVDYRPLQAGLTNLESIAGNLTHLPFADDAIDSLSCLHVVEHIGLGRYGDPIDPEGSRKAVEELQRVLRPGGRLYLSAPIGREQVCFNAHRVFDPETIPGWLAEMSLKEFSYVNDAGSFFERSLPSQACENEYACGMYMFEKTCTSSTASA